MARWVRQSSLRPYLAAMARLSPATTPAGNTCPVRRNAWPNL